MNLRPVVLMLASLLSVRALAQLETKAPTAFSPQRPDLSTFQIRTFYLANAPGANDANEVQIALRNILSPSVRIYLVNSRRVLILEAPPEEIAKAERLVHDLDGTPLRTYRLTYTIVESDAGKRVGVQHVTLEAIEGQKVTLKQGAKIPVLTGTYDKESQGQQSQFTYVDVGNNFDVTLTRLGNGMQLKSKVEQSSLAPEQSSDPVLRHDPIVRQTVIEGTVIVPMGKPATIGGSDVVGTTRHYDVEVLVEPVD